MANFKKAIEWLLDGKKIRRVEAWARSPGTYIFEHEANGIMEYNEDAYDNWEEIEGIENTGYPIMTVNDFIAHDWEIFEEVK